MKRALLLLAGVAMTSLALAQLSKHKDWAKSPEAYFLTPAEREEWSKIKSDEEAEKFIALYWAKRDPTPATPQNEFKDAVARRIAAADEQFKLRRYARGSESTRGRVFVTLGAPSRASQTRAQERNELAPGAPPGGASTLPGIGNQSNIVTVTWTYDKDRLDPSLGIPELRAQFIVDVQGGSDELINRGAVDRAIAKAAEKSIVNPSGIAGTAPAVPAVSTVNPTVPAAGTGPATVAPPAPAAANLPAASRSALEALLKEKKDESNSAFWGGTFTSNSGAAFYAIELYVPGGKAPAGPVKFGGVVMGESGQEATTFWEDAVLSEMKTGPHTDKVFERSVVLSPGSYRGAFGLFSGESGAALVSATATFRIDSKPSDFVVSPLILANTLTPLTKRPAPTDPFVFGMDKPIRVEPKANRLFAKEDSLWYFYTVWNPKLPAASAEAAAAKEQAPAAPAPATTPGAAAAATAPEGPKPRVQARIGVLKDGQPAFAPLTGPAEMQILTPGYYAAGSEIPLATFEPGYYTFTLTVRDLNAPKDSAAFKGIDRREDFVVLNPDGSMPEKTAPKPAVTPKPKPKK